MLTIHLTILFCKKAKNKKEKNFKKHRTHLKKLKIHVFIFNLFTNKHFEQPFFLFVYVFIH